LTNRAIDQKLWNHPALKSGIVSLIALFISFFLIVRVVLYKESWIVTFLLTLNVFYLILTPGFFISLYAHDKLGFKARLVLGSAFTIAITSILSYYLGLAGVHVRYHSYFLPALIIAMGVLLFIKEQGRVRS